MLHDKYPVVLYSLDDGDEGQVQGAKFRVDDLAGDQFFFKDQELALQWIALHGCQQVNEEDMIQIRKGMPDKEG